MTRFEKAVLIAADNIETLRRTDVFRVLNDFNGNRAGLAAFIATKRPDLVAEVAEIMEEGFA